MNAQLRNGNRRQDRDNGDDNHNLDKREPLVSLADQAVGLDSSRPPALPHPPINPATNYRLSVNVVKRIPNRLAIVNFSIRFHFGWVPTLDQIRFLFYTSKVFSNPYKRNFSFP